MQDDNLRDDMKMELNAILQIEHGILFPIMVVKIWSDVDGCSKLNVNHIAYLRGVRLDLLLKASINDPGSILQKPTI